MLPEILAGFKTLGSLLQFGISAREAWKEAGLSRDEVNAISALFRAGDGLIKLKASKDEARSLGAVHLAIVARCFGQAIKQLPSTTLALFQSILQAQKPNRPSEEVLSDLLKDAARAWVAPGQMPVGQAELELVESLTGNPLDTPYYRFFWDALTTSSEGQPPSLQLQPGERLQFERAFLLALGEAMASDVAEQLRRYLDELHGDYKPALLKQLLISDMADWGSRHTFGGLTRDAPRDGDPLPFMPLEEMYIEPSAEEVPGKSTPVLKKIEHLLQRHGVIIVQADFGTGKSLTARMLAYQLAKEFRDANKPSPSLIFPIYIRSADDLKPQALSHENIVRHALKRHSTNLGFSLKLNDSALKPPDGNQRVLYLIDGLDEVHLGEKGLAELFENIKAEVNARHQFIVFSRPGALPSRREVRALEDVPFLQLLQWNDHQVDEWLKRWRKINEGLGPTRQEVDGKGIGELARTPILLLMIAHTWKSALLGEHLTKAELYELFFQSIARGKHESDRDIHPALFVSSQKLRDHLVSKHLLKKETQPADAMLWLMSRVAWEAVRLQHRGLMPSTHSEVLTKGDIRTILNKELGFRNESTVVVETVQIGLLIALQVNLHADNASQILFGHKSFREFLTARYWADKLKAACKVDAEPEDRAEIEKLLLGGRLLGEDDRSFDFLIEIINSKRSALSLSTSEREEVFRWLEARFRDERFLGAESQSRLRDDHGAWFREAALAIASCLGDSRGLRQKDPFTLRSLLAWYWFAGITPIVIAPKAQFEGARLSNLELPRATFESAHLKQADFHDSNLEGANFNQADLEAASFQGAILRNANLQKANLRGADLIVADGQFAHFEEADLSVADLRGARLQNSNLSKADLAGARLEGANLERAYLDEAILSEAFFFQAYLQGAILTKANLDGAILDEADLMRANLSRASLQGAHLEDVNLQNADLRGADLQGASLLRANLRGADLRGANLRSTHLEGAKFQGACLEEAIFQGARHDQNTDWSNAYPNLVGTILAEDEALETAEASDPDDP